MPCVRIIVVTDDATLTPFFSADNKMPSLVSIHAELTGVTGVFEVRPVLEGSGRDADPCQRQLLGPFVLAKNNCSSAHRLGATPPACLPYRLPSLNGVVPQQPLACHRLRRTGRNVAVRPDRYPPRMHGRRVGLEVTELRCCSEYSHPSIPALCGAS